MVDAAEALCPCVMKKTHLRQELIKAGAGRMVVPRSFVKATLLEQSGVDIINKIRYDLLWDMLVLSLSLRTVNVCVRYVCMCLRVFWLDDTVSLASFVVCSTTLSFSLLT